MRTTAVLFLVVAVLLSVGCRRSQPAAPATIGPAGQAPAAASSAVAELPDYPGAVRVGWEQKGPGDGYSRRVEAKFTTADPYATVKAFYQNAIAAAGWQVLSTDEKVDEVKWELAKGASVAEVEIDTSSGGGIEIELKRKDR